MPLNEAGLRKAESWDASILSLRERQCIPHIVTYALRGPANIRIWKSPPDPTTGEVNAYNMIGTYGRPRTIWIDGRPHPSPYAPHTWTGFSTGEWRGGAFVVTTTHVKTGWLQRNGAAHSDQVTMTEYFIRHQNQMLVVTILDDPIYLDEPFVRTTNFQLTLTGTPNDWGSCGPAVNEVGDHGKGYVPHYLPGENPYLSSARASQHLTDDAGRGGVATIYPSTPAAGVRRTALRPPRGPPPPAPAHVCGAHGRERERGSPAGGPERVRAGVGRRQRHRPGRRPGSARRGRRLDRTSARPS